MIEYVGLAEKTKSGYTIFFPDFPGFGSAGKSIKEVRKNAREGLITHVELMVEGGELVPKPTSVDDIIKLPDAKGCIPLFISIIAPVGKAQRINITIDQALLNAVDNVAHTLHKSRSALLAEAAQQFLGEV